jgi:hypothetical protein
MLRGEDIYACARTCVRMEGGGREGHTNFSVSCQLLTNIQIIIKFRMCVCIFLCCVVLWR